MSSVKKIVHRTLVINPGSTSTKIAVFDDFKENFNTVILHSISEIAKYKKVAYQYVMRYKLILNSLEKANIQLRSINCIMARGGLLRPIEGGVWKINKKMVDELKEAKMGEHPCNLAAIIAYNIGKQFNIPCYIADPVVVDELIDIARITGIPDIPKISIFHALNQKYSAHLIAEKLGKKYEDLNLIVTHMGGGITIGAHKNGKVVDVNNGLYGEGPFTPVRCGSISPAQILNLYLSKKYTEEEIRKLIAGRGGLTAYFGESDAKILFNDIDNPKIRVVIDAMIYQISKYICSLSAIFHGKVHAVILTGGLANSEYIVKNIISYVDFLGPVFVLAGENEMEALNERSVELQREEINAKIYS